MHVRRLPQFDQEAARFALRFTCEDCGHFDAARESCNHGWPVFPHRRARYLVPPPEGASEVIFCKEFDLL